MVMVLLQKRRISYYQWVGTILGTTRMDPWRPVVLMWHSRRTICSFTFFTFTVVVSIRLSKWSD